MADSPPRPTQRTIAREAGVSAVTVSLALRNHASIPEPTRKRIHNIAEAQGYQSDPNITKLMHHLRMRRTKNLSSNLVALRKRPESKSHYQSKVLVGVMEQAARLGYALEVINLEEPSLSPAKLGKILRNRGVEGLVLLPMEPADLSDLTDWSRFSVVATSYSVLKPRFNTVVPNQFSNMLKLCAQLAAAGENRIGIVTTIAHDLKVNHRFISAYFWHTMSGNGTVIPPLLVESHLQVHRHLLKWIEKHDPKVILTFQNNIDLNLPEEVRRRIKWVRTGLASNADGQSGIFENPKEVGRAAIDVLAGMLQRGDRGIPISPRCTEIEGEVKLAVRQE
jgi:LacI family transcriptional regulator